MEDQAVKRTPQFRPNERDSCHSVTQAKLAAALLCGMPPFVPGLAGMKVL